MPPWFVEKATPPLPSPYPFPVLSPISLSDLIHSEPARVAHLTLNGQMGANVERRLMSVVFTASCFGVAQGLLVGA